MRNAWRCGREEDGRPDLAGSAPTAIERLAEGAQRATPLAGGEQGLSRPGQGEHVAALPQAPRQAGAAGLSPASVRAKAYRTVGFSGEQPSGR